VQPYLANKMFEVFVKTRATSRIDTE